MADTATEHVFLQQIVQQLADVTMQTAALAEGLRHDLEAKDLSPEAVSAVTEALAAQDALKVARLARQRQVQALLNTGYPDLYAPIPPKTVPAAILAELKQNHETQRLAEGQFHVEGQAAALNPRPGDVESK